MTYVEVVVLAFVQGFTEFLPVSSSGHLLLARYLMHVPEVNGTAFDTMLHLGTLIAVILYYWRRWFDMALSVFDSTKTESRKLLVLLIIATIPAALVGYLAEDIVEEYFRGPLILAISFFITAMILIISDRLAGSAEITALTKKHSFLIGLAQIIALVPAISRSGVTIGTAMAQGLSRKAATDFSFLMSAPIIAGASILSLGQLLVSHEVPALQMGIGILIAFVSGLLSIHLLLHIVKKLSFMPFALYLIFLSILTLFIT